MSTSANFLQQVQTYSESQLAYLLNYSCFIATANTKYKEFQKMPANLGSTVTFDLPPRFEARDGLVASFQEAKQRVQSLTVDKSKNTSFEFSSQQMIFNINPMEYMGRFGDGAVVSLAGKVEADVAVLAEQIPFRYSGDGLTDVTSYTQIAKFLADYRTFGSDLSTQTKVYLSDTSYPQIIGSGLNQFVTSRNEGLSEYWDIGSFARADFFQTNILPIHYSGSTGNNGTPLTVVSTNDPTGKNITQITVSGANVSDADAVKKHDSFTIRSADNRLRFLTFSNYVPSAAPVQVRATADAASNGSGNVTIDIYPPLSIDPASTERNITTNIVAGMQVTGLPDHRCGVIVGGNSLYLAMPSLDEQRPYDSSVSTDPVTQVSTRLTYGSILGENRQGFIYDCIYGFTGVPEYWHKIALPLN